MNQIEDTWLYVPKNACKYKSQRQETQSEVLNPNPLFTIIEKGAKSGEIFSEHKQWLFWKSTFAGDGLLMQEAETEFAL